MKRWLPFCFIVCLVMLFRALGSALPESQPNFQPLAALFFCGAWLLGGWRGFAVPAAAWLVTYPLPALFQGRTEYLSPGVLLVTLLAFGATYQLGRAISARGVPVLLAGSLAAALAFHLITNGAAWLGSPMYPKNPVGLWQSLWAGPAGSPLPSWIFLRNLMAANLIFTAIVLLARVRLPLAVTHSGIPARAES
jgi:hypothetical protein